MEVEVPETIRPPDIADLSPRERQVFQLFLGGLRSQQIATSLRIHPKTVSTHYISIQRKLRTTNPVELVKIGMRAGLISL